MQLPVTFLYPVAALVTAILGLGILWARSRRQPAVQHSQVGIHRNLKSFPIVGWLPTVFYSCFIVAMAGLFAWAVLPEDVEKHVADTRDVLISVDQSGSMGSPLAGGPPQGLEWPADRGQFRKIDLAEWAVQVFVPRRQGDRVGLTVFDDNTYRHWPMTDHLKIIIRKSKLLSKGSGGGTNFEGPTGPIQTAIEHFKVWGKAKTKVLILVTDGEAPISDQRMEELTAQMKALGGKIYVLGIGDDWTNPSSYAASQTEPIKKLVAALGGKCFAVGDAKQMAEALAVVDQLEKSQVVLERSTTFQDAYQYFAAASFISLVLVALAVFVTREVA